MSARPGPHPGIDLIEVDRIERALERRPGLAERLFTATERDYASTKRRPGRHLAARFAAKEATIKALGVTLAPAEIEVVAGPGAPRIRLHGRAAAEARRRRLDLAVSLTHSREIAAAVVIAAPAA